MVGSIGSPNIRRFCFQAGEIRTYVLTVCMYKYTYNECEWGTAQCAVLDSHATVGILFECRQSPSELQLVYLGLFQLLLETLQPKCTHNGFNIIVHSSVCIHYMYVCINMHTSRLPTQCTTTHLDSWHAYIHTYIHTYICVCTQIRKYSLAVPGPPPPSVAAIVVSDSTPPASLSAPLRAGNDPSQPTQASHTVWGACTTQHIPQCPPPPTALLPSAQRTCL